MYYNKIGPFLAVTVDIVQDFAPGAWTELCTLPAAVRPRRSFYANTLLHTLCARLYVSHEGRVAVYNLTSSKGGALSDTFVIPLA